MTCGMQEHVYRPHEAQVSFGPQVVKRRMPCFRKTKLCYDENMCHAARSLGIWFVKQVIAEGLTCFGDSADALRRRFGCKVLGSITCGTF